MSSAAAGPLGRLWRPPAVRKTVIVAALLVAWELATRWAASPLLFPTAVSVLQAFGRSIANFGGYWNKLQIFVVMV